MSKVVRNPDGTWKMIKIHKKSQKGMTIWTVFTMMLRAICLP